MISLTILGSGTSTGVPLLQCTCSVCRSKNPRNHRLRSSAYLQIKKGPGESSAQTKSILIDTSPDLRQQAFRYGVNHIDAVLYTHPHADHCHGIDELRSFNFVQKSTIPIYGNEWTLTELTTRFPYIFRPGPAAGGGIPALVPVAIDRTDPSFDAAGVDVIPISLHHGRQETLGYRIENVAYIIDCNQIESTSLAQLKNLSVLVLDCLRLEPHDTHMHLARALEIIADLRPKKAFLTHMGHEFEFGKYSRKGALPKGVALAYDGLKVRTS